MAAVEARAVVDVVVAADQHGRHVELGEHVESGLHHVLRHPAVVEEVADDQGIRPVLLRQVGDAEDRAQAVVTPVTGLRGREPAGEVHVGGVQEPEGDA